jgi:transposase
MPAAIRLTVTPAAYAELTERFEATRDAQTRLRYQMVLLAADGMTAPQIAPLVRRSVATVERVLRRYRQEGADGVPPRSRPGRAPTAPAAWRAELARVIDLDPHTVGVPSAVWSLRLLAGYLAEVTGHQAGLTQVWRALHALDFVCKRPVHSVKHKAQSQPDWPKKA